MESSLLSHPTILPYYIFTLLQTAWVFAASKENSGGMR